MQPTVSGFVLTGGSSSRFGSNKLFHRINESCMGIVVYNNMQTAVDGGVCFLGPVIDHQDFSPFAQFSGNREGQGPLGALCDALESATTDFVVFAPCDTPGFLSVHFEHLIASSIKHDVVVAADIDPPQLRHWLLSCWNVEATRSHMVKAFSSGERAIHRAITGLNVADQRYENAVLMNINTPADAQ